MSAQDLSVVIAALTGGLVAVLGAIAALFARMRSVEEQISKNRRHLEQLDRRRE